MSRSVLAGIGLLILAGCASGGASGAKRSTRQMPNVITAQEIAATTGLANALEAIQRLRPQFLRPHGPNTFSGTSNSTERALPVVFVGNQKFGDVNSLRDILISDVQEIHYLSPSEATVRWGTGYSSGVIQVIRKSS